MLSRAPEKKRPSKVWIIMWSALTALAIVVWLTMLSPSANAATASGECYPASECGQSGPQNSPNGYPAAPGAENGTPSDEVVTCLGATAIGTAGGAIGGKGSPWGIAGGAAAGLGSCVWYEYRG